MQSLIYGVISDHFLKQALRLHPIERLKIKREKANGGYNLIAKGSYYKI